MLPQLGQAWQEPARIICTPHCMHIGASLTRAARHFDGWFPTGPADCTIWKAKWESLKQQAEQLSTAVAVFRMAGEPSGTDVSHA